VDVRVILAEMLRVRLPVIPPVILPVGPLLADVSVVVDPALSLEVAVLSPEDAELSAAATVSDALTVGKYTCTGLSCDCAGGNIVGCD
jgi:hypothetical protein